MQTLDRFAKKYPKDRMIFCEYEPGDTSYLIQRGRIRIAKIIGSIEKTIDILNPGEIFGEMAVLERAPRSASAIAMDEVVLLEFNRENFEVLMGSNPQIAIRLMKLFSKRIYDQRRRFLILKLDNIQARVADVFLMLSETMPVNDLNETQRVFMTTPEDIAHWAGISPEESRIIINGFSAQRRLEIGKDRITVMNIHDFARFVTSQRKES